MQPLNFQTQDEFINAFLELVELNKGAYTPEEILAGMRDRGVFIGGKDISKYNMSPENDEKIQAIVDGTYSEEGEDELVPGEYGYEEQQENKKNEEQQNMSFSERAQQDDWNKKNNWDKIQDVVGRYETILMDLKKLVDDNNSGQGLSDEALAEYKKEVENKKQQLRDIEQSKELYKLMEDVANRGTGKFLTDTGLLSPKTGAILDLMTGGDYSGGYGSELFSDTDALKNGADYLTNTWFDNAGYATFNSTATPQDIARSFILKGGNKEASNKGNKEGDNKETKSNNKNNISVNGPFKPMNPTDEKTTDEMSFGSGVKGAGGNQYLEERNKSLALHLKMKGIETPEEIDAYLSKYPSWKEAKQEWKDNTLNILSDKISNMKGGIVSGKKGEEKKEEKNIEGNKGEAREVKDKKRLNGDKGATRDVKDKKRLGDDWAPDNDSSINGTEDLKTDEDWNNFWNEDQKKEIKKETKNNDKKQVKKVSMKDIVKVVKSSPTIKNLLKNSKK